MKYFRAALLGINMGLLLLSSLYLGDLALSVLALANITLVLIGTKLRKGTWL